MECKKCKKKFEPSKGLKNYCSLECRNSRSWSEKDKLKKSISAKNSNKVKQANKNKPAELYERIGEVRKANHKKKILESDYGDLSFDSLRYRIIYEQDGCCNKCGLKVWLDNEIPLELEHKDGNNQNNERINLEMLCPNCHALTDTWRGRNKNKRINKIPYNVLFESLMENEWNMRQALLDVGLAAKGGNYKRCHKLKREYLGINNNPH